MIRELFRLAGEITDLLLPRKCPRPPTKTTFKALVASVIPPAPDLAGRRNSPAAGGAAAAHLDEYHIWLLDHYVSLNIMGKYFPLRLANATAQMLDTAADQLAAPQKADPEKADRPGPFAALSPADRCRTITLLEQLQIDLASLPVPFRRNPGIVLAMISILNMLTTIGYYSEWSGYGSTRLEPAAKRKLEHFPAGWQGYHALRGYLIKDFAE